MTNPELRKRPGPKGQRESRVQSKDPTGRDKRMDHSALENALARIGFGKSKVPA